LPTAITSKFEVILSRERSWAIAVAVRVMKPKPLGVWDVMIPVIFIINYMASKKSRELFAENLLFTKKLALEAARDILKKGLSRHEVLARIHEKTSEVLASEKDGIYSEEIRQKQMKEMDLLIDHYLKLLEAEGKDYRTLVINAYQSQQNYEAFLKKLKAAEQEVMLAAKQTLGSKAAPEVLYRMEEASDSIRVATLNQIFGPDR